MSKTEFDSLNKAPSLARGVQFGYRKNSKISQGFVVGDDRLERRDFLKKTFDLIDGTRFDKKYEEACMGSGSPYKDFDSLKSSALCALLSFYRISDLQIGNEHYDKAYFEVQNTVIPGRKPSNMDVVLISKDNKTILFLECKFSEYITNAKQTVSNDYLDKCELSNKLYDLVVKNELGTIERGEKEFIFKTKDAYSQGTKQVISHLVGITSFIYRKSGYENNFKFFKDDDRRKIYDMKFEKIIFQEILFKLKGYETQLKNYIELSEKVRNVFVNSGLINKIDFAPATTYQKVFNDQKGINIDNLVADFYEY